MSEPEADGDRPNQGDDLPYQDVEFVFVDGERCKVVGATGIASCWLV